MKKLFLGNLFLMLLLAGCGYKPQAQYAKEVLGKNIYAQVNVSKQDPKNSVLIQDALNEAIITRFKGRLSSKATADTLLYASIGSINFSPILYDADGYVISYKARVTLRTKYTLRSGKSHTLSTTGEYDFPIEANSVISDTKRFEAIRLASTDALNELVSAITVRGMQ